MKIILCHSKKQIKNKFIIQNIIYYNLNQFLTINSKAAKGGKVHPKKFPFIKLGKMYNFKF